jgi:hypothetical protein
VIDDSLGEVLIVACFLKGGFGLIVECKLKRICKVILYLGD